MKKCPFCAEEIQDEAVVCRHCGRVVSATVLDLLPRYGRMAKPQQDAAWAALSQPEREAFADAWQRGGWATKGVTPSKRPMMTKPAGCALQTIGVVLALGLGGAFGEAIAGRWGVAFVWLVVGCAGIAMVVAGGISARRHTA